MTRPYDPGRDAAERYPDWVIRHRPLHGVPEVLSWRHKTILIDSDQSWAAKRCSLAHALAHLDLDHRATLGGRFERREEQQADELAATRMIPFDALIEAAVWTRDVDELAEELNVDRTLLTVRIERLSREQRFRLDVA